MYIKIHAYANYFYIFFHLFIHRLLQVRNSTRIRNIVELKARQEQERLLRERQRYQFEPPTNLKHQQLSSVQSRARRRLARELATTTRTSTTTTRDSQN